MKCASRQLHQSFSFNNRRRKKEERSSALTHGEILELLEFARVKYLRFLLDLVVLDELARGPPRPPLPCSMGSRCGTRTRNWDGLCSGAASSSAHLVPKHDATALCVAHAVHRCTTHCASTPLLVFVGHRKLGALDGPAAHDAKHDARVHSARFDARHR